MNSGMHGSPASSSSSPLALVTGASSGLGAALARSLAHRGWKVVAASRSARLSGGDGSAEGIEAMRLDVTDTTSIAAAIEVLTRRQLPIDLLVNNAGINIPGVVEEVSREQGRAVMDTNFYGVVDMTRAVLPGMRQRGKGAILTIGSLSGLVPTPGEAYYAASKHALEGFLEAMQYEVRAFGIQVRLAEPGYIATNLASASPEVAAPIDQYQSMRGALRSNWQTAISRGMPAETMAAQIIDWTLDSRGFRRRFGSDARWIPVVKRLLPEAAFFAAVRRRFGVNGAR